MFRPALVIVNLVDRLTQEIDKVRPDSPSCVPEPQGPHAATSAPGLGTPHPAEAHSRAPGSPGQGDTSASYEALIPPPPDTSFPEGLARIDLFEYLNADFDLGAIDAVLGDTTYPYFPHS